MLLNLYIQGGVFTFKCTARHCHNFQRKRVSSLFFNCFFFVSGNLLTIVALLRCPKLRSHATTAFVLSLCLSDLLFCSFNLPLTAARYIYEEWIFGETMCKIFPVLFYGNVAVSVLNMVAITINRYLIFWKNKLI